MRGQFSRYLPITFELMAAANRADAATDLSSVAK